MYEVKNGDKGLQRPVNDIKAYHKKMKLLAERELKAYRKEFFPLIPDRYDQETANLKKGRVKIPYKFFRRSFVKTSQGWLETTKRDENGNILASSGTAYNPDNGELSMCYRPSVTKMSKVRAQMKIKQSQYITNLIRVKVGKGAITARERRFLKRTKNF